MEIRRVVYRGSAAVSLHRSRTEQMLAVDISHRSCETRLDSIEAGQVYDIDGAIRRGGPGEKRRRGKESFGVDGEGRYVQSLEELFPGSRSF